MVVVVVVVVVVAPTTADVQVPTKVRSRSMPFSDIWRCSRRGVVRRGDGKKGRGQWSRQRALRLLEANACQSSDGGRKQKRRKTTAAVD